MHSEINFPSFHHVMLVLSICISLCHRKRLFIIFWRSQLHVQNLKRVSAQNNLTRPLLYTKYSINYNPLVLKSSVCNVSFHGTGGPPYPRVIDSSWNMMTHGDAREGNCRGNWRMQWVASTLHTTSERGLSSITTADAHTSAASSRLNWRPHRAI